MGNLKKNVSDKLEILEDALDILTKVFGKTKPFKTGEKTAGGFSKIIDKIVDKILPK